MANENYVMMANNPTGTGSFSLNRKAGTTVGYSSHAEGYGITASGDYSHAEGKGTTASTYSSHAEGSGTKASGHQSHAEGRSTEATGEASHVEGYSTTASGYASHAEGDVTIASASFAHAEGNFTIASGESSHAEGCRSVAQGLSSHAEGWSDDTKSIGSMTVTAVNENVLTFGDTTFASWSEISKGKSIISLKRNKMKMIISDFDSEAKTLTLSSSILVDVGDVVEIYSHGPTMALGAHSHAEGNDTIAFGYNSHTEGHNTTALGNNSHAEGYETTASGDQSHAEGTSTIASNHESHAEGMITTASGAGSHAEGHETTASGYASHAEGELTKASEYYAHAEGVETTASGVFSHAEGKGTTASNYGSHAEGGFTTASGVGSHAEGKTTTASNYASHASGKYNVAMKTGGTEKNTTGTAFVIGNGTGDSVLSNAFSVQYNGTVKAKSTITASTTADYAEFFEWIDKNTNEEDRVGHFVTLDGDKIKIATSEDDYILGIVSGEPFVLGNGDCDTWNGMFLHDEFRRTMYEPAPKIIEILDNKGNPTGEYEEVEGEYEGTRPILNPDYDPTQKYISRFDRTEWSPVGMLGVLAVLHDGTAEVNGYVTVNNEGIATKCARDTRNSYRVIKKISDKVVEVIFR